VTYSQIPDRCTEKRTRESSTEKSSSKKTKKTGEKKDSYTVKELIRELSGTSGTSSNDQVNTITLQPASALESSADSINFRDLYIKIVNAEDQSKKSNQKLL